MSAAIEIPDDVLTSLAQAAAHIGRCEFSEREYKEAKASGARGVGIGVTKLKATARAANLTWGELTDMSKKATVIKTINIADISRDGGTQIRVTTDPATVARYSENLGKLPPITVFFDGESYWMADGFHRTDAHEVAGKADILAEVHMGNRRDAVLFACGANAEHGKPRSRADRRNAVLTVLQDPEWSEKYTSGREVARICGVSHTLVQNIKKERWPATGALDGGPQTPGPAPQATEAEMAASADDDLLDHQATEATPVQAWARKVEILRQSMADDLAKGRKLASEASDLNLSAHSEVYSAMDHQATAIGALGDVIWE